MMSHARAGMLALLLALLLVACIPQRVVTQPELRLHIQNDTGEPLAATVTLHWWEQPHRHQRAVTAATTDANGRVTFTETVTTEVMNYMLPHGVPVYNWTFCIEAAGYKTLIGTVSDVAPGATVVAMLVLHPGESLPVCDDYERLPFHDGTPVEAVTVTGGEVHGLYEVDGE